MVRSAHHLALFVAAMNHAMHIWEFVSALYFGTYFGGYFDARLCMSKMESDITYDMGRGVKQRFCRTICGRRQTCNGAMCGEVGVAFAIRLAAYDDACLRMLALT